MTPCQHHWLLAEPDGTANVRGVCLHCGTTKGFPVAMPSFKSWTRMLHDGAMRDEAAVAEAEAT